MFSTRKGVPFSSRTIGRAVPAYRIHLRPPLEPAAQALRAQPWVNGVEPDGPETLRVTVTSLTEAEVLLAGVLSASDARLVSLAPLAADLEDVFLELTS